ncbi:hypothetical protein [Ideonella azotifigens]|nr:hypothetical protein [Ideonella azotifigens]
MRHLSSQAHQRIEQLEHTVSELKGTLGLLVSEMRRQGIVLPVGKVQRRQGRSASPRPAANDAPATATGLAAAVARGEAAKVEWVQSGEVVPAKLLADHWGLTPQALGPAADRGEVFAILVKRQRYYPREFLDLDRHAVGAVAQALSGLSPTEKLVFWKRPHGGLGGKTVLQALTATNDAAQLARVVQLARSWAEEAHPKRDGVEVA